MKDLDHFVKLGKKEFNLEGAELQKWATEQFDKAIAAYEAEKKAEREHELKSKEAEREHELKMKELELELLRENSIRADSTSPIGSQTSCNRLPRTPAFKFSCFNEKVDDLDSWFSLFEKQCAAFGVADNDRTGHLLGLFTGKYRDTLLTFDVSDSYSYVRDNFLSTYNLTQNGYREKFFKLKPNSGESITAYIQRLQACFDKWVSLSKIDLSFDSVRDLIITHQIFESCHPEFIRFILEREINNTNDIKDKAGGFFQAHPDVPLCKPRDTYLGVNSTFKGNFKPSWNHDSGSRSEVHRGKFKHGDRWDRDTWKHGSRGLGQGNYKACLLCNKHDHVYKDCPIKREPCKYCNIPGHHAAQCYKLNNNTKKSNIPPGKSSNFEFSSQSLSIPTYGDIDRNRTPWRDQHIYTGLVFHGKDNRSVTVLRDTGSAVHAAHANIINDMDYLGKSQDIVTFGGKKETFRLAKLQVDTPFITGEIIVCVLDNYPEKFRYFDVLIGNGGTLGSPIALDPSPEVINSWYFNKGANGDDSNSDHPAPCHQVTTRSHSIENENGILDYKCLDFNISSAELASMQRNDSSLSAIFKLVGAPPKIYSKGRKSSKCSFELRNCVLVRIYSSSDQERVQILVPSSLRARILSLAHDKPFGAHMGINRTLFRLLLSFYWPGVSGDVRKFCKSCDTCLKMKPKGKTPKVPLQTSQAFDKPFHKCAIDLIGPLPMTERKNRFVLTLIDYTTRWVEAVPLKDTSTSAVADELLNMFARFGLPTILLSDGGTQFTSSQMEEILRLLGINHPVSTPYHPQSNGLCERANATIKSMIKKLSFDNPTAWDKLLQCALFAYREVPQETTGFAPFELVYGSIPRGPLTLLRDSWLNQDLGTNGFSNFDYVNNLRKKIEYSCGIAKERSESQMNNSRIRSTGKYKHRSFQVGDQVLLSLPTTNSKFTNKWKGPFPIVKICPNSEVNYVIDINGKHKTFHVDLLQEYTSRPKNLTPDYLDDEPVESNFFDGLENESLSANDSTVDDLMSSAVSLILDDPDPIDAEGSNNFSQIVLPELKQKESVLDVTINPNLDQRSRSQLHEIIQSYAGIFSDIPSKTNCITHKIKLSSDVPIVLKPYPLPFTSEQVIRDEINFMLRNDVIETSDSPYSSPIVLVKKKDGSVRFCIDFRALNAITIGDACPIPDHDKIMASMCKAKYFTKLDLTKGYWQIEIDEQSRQFTAFQAAGELYQFKRMAFGLKNAPMTFNRLMNRLLGHRSDVVFFFDDVTIFHCDWDEHIKALHEVFEIFRSNNLTIKPSKTEIAFHEIQFLGHMIGGGVLRPMSDNVGKILSIKIPKTKKQVRGIIGLINFYSKFVKNLADLLAPLHELTRKGCPEKIVWTEQCQSCLDRIQTIISSEPVLIVPDVNDQFFVQTDASGDGIGCTLLQRRDGLLKPCRFHSRKLLPREANYSVIERECLAIVWALQKLARFLIGNKFVLQTDHASLQHIQKGRTINARVTRWFLTLQQFDFSVEHIKGTENVIADYLSRA